MNLSMPMRGLAVSAVSALALTGLAIAGSPAHAAGPGAVLVSQFNAGADASTRHDWSDFGIRLAAVVLDPAAQVSFEYHLDPEAGNADAGWRAIEALPETTGSLVTVVWDGSGPRNSSLAGSAVSVRSVAVTESGSTYSLRNGVDIAEPESDAQTVAVNAADAGYFTQPYADSGHTATTMTASGSTSARDGTVELSWWRSSDGTFRGQTDAQVIPVAPPIKFPDDFDYGGRFTDVVDITGFDTERNDAIILGAERDTDDVRAVPLYEQTVATVDAHAAGSAPRGGTGAVVVFVRDSQGRSIVGAEVRRTSDGSLAGYTDGEGRVDTRQTTESDSYYVNTRDSDAFTEGEDVTSQEVTTSTYDPEGVDVWSAFDDGDVFDRDEYAAGDVHLDVGDQAGQGFGGAEVAYRLYAADGVAPESYRSATTDADGRAVVELDPTVASGEYVLAYRLPSWPSEQEDATARFVIGDAALTLSPKASPVVAEPGGQIEYVGRLSVEGSALPGRRVDLTYARGLELAPGRTADAGIVTDRGLALRQTLTTGRGGAFRVTLDDPAESTQGAEDGGRLTATTGVNVARENVGLDGNPRQSIASTTRFGSTRGRVTVRLGGFGSGARRAEVLKVAGPTSVSGETVRFFRVLPGGRRQLVAARRLNANGDVPRVRVADGNGRALTTYVVDLVTSSRVLGSTSNRTRLR